MKIKIRKPKRFKIPSKYVLIFMTVLCGLLIIVSLSNQKSMRLVKNAVATVFVPIQSGMNQVAYMITNQINEIRDIDKLQDENKKLKEKIDELSNENILLLQEKTEYDRLMELYALDTYYSDYPKVAARVISKDTGNWFSTFTIDKGSDDGIAVDMNVIAGTGLVGIVTEVGKNYAVVRSIIDDLSNVSAKAATTNDTCIVQGDLKLINEGILNVVQLNIDADVKDGDMLLTSNISDKYVQGILIGYIKNITNDANNLTKSANVTPVVDFGHLEIVLVITQLKEKVQKD